MRGEKNKVKVELGEDLEVQVEMEGDENELEVRGDDFKMKAKMD
jgi:hypothetical protein